jgi:hypothetical protein
MHEKWVDHCGAPNIWTEIFLSGITQVLTGTLTAQELERTDHQLSDLYRMDHIRAYISHAQVV